jgi:hypothetical protein
MAMAIMMHEGMSASDAIKTIEKARPQVAMLPNQINKVKDTFRR